MGGVRKTPTLYEPTKRKSSEITEETTTETPPFVISKENLKHIAKARKRLIDILISDEYEDDPNYLNRVKEIRGKARDQKLGKDFVLTNKNVSSEAREFILLLDR